jgi:hypothetical protein
MKEHKDVHYVCNALDGYIETIGMDNIVQICRNNASNMWNAIILLIHHFSKPLLSKLCSSCLDMLLEDWGKELG